tara:strand:- start:3728 stop:5482 length:1755 start_codon:yes stop_codon:yes gene_type:complete
MRAKLLFLILFGYLLQSSCMALSLPKLPFVASEISILLQGNKPLQAILVAELSHQRATNRQLQQYLKPNKIARYEIQLLTAHLRAEGYYAAELSFALKEQQIVYSVDPGPLYRIVQLSIELPPGISIADKLVALHQGDALNATAVHTAVAALRNYVASEYCLYKVNVRYSAKVLHPSHSAELRLILEDSPAVTVGEIRFHGLQSVEEDYLRQRLPFKSGDCYKAASLDRAQLQLMQTSLLVRTDIQPGQPVDGLVPISIRIAERVHRTLSAGIGFQTDNGVGLSLGWDHRNLMGRAENLSIDSLLSDTEQRIETTLTVPLFRQPNQSLSLFNTAQRMDSDAFNSQLAIMGAEIARALTPRLRASVGVELEFSQIEEGFADDSFTLISLPLSLNYDRRDNPLDPRHGWVMGAVIRPYQDLAGAGREFLQSTVAASGYHSFDRLPWQPTLALRLAMGAISGIQGNQVPANLRFYSGGGGSVRGYPFQTLGSITDGTPDGGLSFTELSFETRVRWGADWGAVAFIDGGYAFADASPQLNTELLWGAGLGLRYYTSFAPIRFDIGVPLNQRAEIDDSFQVYISIGQAF